MKHEINQAVAHHWGVCTHTVSTWRQGLDVARSNEGTHKLHAEWMPERLDEEARERLRESLKSPERGAKISAAQKGRKQRPESIAKMRKARKGFRHTKESRAKMRAAHLERYEKLGRWKPEEDAKLGTMSDPKLAKVLGRNRTTIQARRLKLGIASFRKHGPSTPSREWTAAVAQFPPAVGSDVIARLYVGGRFMRRR